MAGVAGFVVHNLMGLKIGKKYDWLECSVRFDGAVNANANSRLWSISDRYSPKGEMPWAKDGLAKIVEDTEKDWKPTLGANNELNYTSCPPLKKCIFQCAAERPFTTNDASQDF